MWELNEFNHIIPNILHHNKFVRHHGAPPTKQPWPPKWCEKPLRQLHFEDAGDPTGTKWTHSINYRPNGVPKVGLYVEHYRRQCCLFIPERDMSFDEATARYRGRMTGLKHLQSKYTNPTTV